MCDDVMSWTEISSRDGQLWIEVASVPSTPDVRTLKVIIISEFHFGEAQNTSFVYNSLGHLFKLALPVSAILFCCRQKN